MAPVETQDASGASTSATLLPTGIRSRRDSLSSITSRSHLDKEVINQALDQIHSSASRSSALTTFKDFAPPPPSSSDNSHTLSGQVSQTAIGGLYSRLRASVGGTAKDSASSSTPSQQNHTQGAATKQPTIDSTQKSPKAIASPPKTPTTSTNPSARAHTPETSPKPSNRKGKRSVPSSPPTFAFDTSIGAFPGDDDVVSLAPSTASNAQNESRRIVSEGSHNVSVSPEARDHGKEGGGATSLHSQHTTNSSSSKKAARPQSPLDISKDVSKSPRGLAPTTTTTTTTKSQRSSRPSSTAGKDASRRKSEDAKNADKPIEHGERGRTPSHRQHVELPGFHMSRATSLDGSESVSSKQTSSINRRGGQESLGRPFEDVTGSMQSQQSFVSDMKRKVLSRDFWMKDENAKVCYNCGEQFSTFRRKHHCRLCGQIYCNSCTNLISGKTFGQASKLRVCKTCEGMMNGEQSPDYSDEEPQYSSSPQIKHIRFTGVRQDSIDIGRRSSGDIPTEYGSPHTPYGSPLNPRDKDGKRRSTPNMSFEKTPPLARPNSSRSLRSMGGRPRSSSQRRRWTRSQHMRSLNVPLGTAPFHGDLIEEMSGARALPAFHTDSVIDPDLAPFMSDEGSSDEEAPSIAANLNSDIGDQSNVGFSGLVGAYKRNRPRHSSKGFMDFASASRDADNISLSSSRTGPFRKQIGRTMSFGSLGRSGAYQRVVQSDNLFASSDALATPGFDENFGENNTDFTFSHYEAPPSIGLTADLNESSLTHVRRLLRQFLDDQAIRHTRRWEKALTPILLKCAANVDPNIHRGDDIDIRHYIKLKKAEGGSQSDTTYVSGVVFTKNLALKGMPRKVKNPRVLLLSFPLIYARHQQHFMSLDPVIAQEREYLRNLVNRIMALKPNVMLVQQNVSGVALQFLQEANVAVAYNVKESVMQAVSRCTKTRIVSSVDKLTMDRHFLGNCESFEVKTFVHQGKKKTYMFFSGCQPDLGCTIVLRGASYATLKKMKWITEFMCYVVYNSKLETSLMRDQFITIPTDTEVSHKNPQESASKVTDLITAIDGKDVTMENSNADKEHEPPRHENNKDTETNHTAKIGILNSTYYDMVELLQKRVLSISPLVNFPEPYLVKRGRDQEEQMDRLKRLQELQMKEIANHTDEEKNEMNQKFELVKPEMIYATSQNTSLQVREILHAIHSAEYEKAFHRYEQLKRRWDAYISGARDPFSPLTHQKIVVLFSIVSTPSGDACEGPDLLGLDFYQEHDINGNLEPDFPLGEYIERLCNQAHSPCTANRCDKKMLDHQRQYVHGDGQISIHIEKCTSRLRGMENTILMWSCCRVCQQETQVTPMSGNTWKYSFGKYLELSFWSRALLPRADLCPHDVHRDHARYFGFKNLSIKVQYDPINIVEVIVPRGTVTWKVEKDLRLKNDQYQSIEDRMRRFMSSVKARIKSIKLNSVTTENLEACKTEVDVLLKRAALESEELTFKLQEKYMSSKYYEIIPLNRAVRFMQEKVAEWDSAFTEFERKFLPSEKDLQYLATQQLKKAYLEQEASKHEDDAENEKQHLPGIIEIEDGTIDEKQVEKFLSDSDQMHIVSSPLEEKLQSRTNTGEIFSSSQSRPINVDSKFQEPQSSRTSWDYEQQVVQNLDLAVPSTSPAAHSLEQKAHLIETGRTTLRDTSQQRQDMHSPSSIDLNGAQNNPTTPDTGTKLEASTPEQARKSPSPIPQARRTKLTPPTTLARAQSQPVTYRLQGNHRSHSTLASESTNQSVSRPTSPAEVSKKPASRMVEAKKYDQASSAASKAAKVAMQSMIPRAVANRRIDSRVSALAKHFEQMSKEFEKERLRERRQRAARLSQARAYPIAASKPIVEIYRDANEAVRERETSYEEHKENLLNRQDPDHSMAEFEKRPAYGDDGALESVAQSAQTPDRIFDHSGDASLTDETAPSLSYPPSEVDGGLSDTELVSETKTKPDLEAAQNTIQPHAESLAEVSLDIPKHEKSSLMKMLTSFWSERSASGWAPLEYPLLPTNHIFADSDVIVREDEPSSVVAFALESNDYREKVQKFRERVKIAEKEHLESTYATDSSEDLDVERVMLGKTATHMRYQFQSGSARMQCKIFFAEAFDAIRRKCGVSDRFVESLARCMTWDSKGGKTKSLFLKTVDDRFVLKSLSTTETQAFLKFAPDYFDYMSKCLFHNLPSALAKMLGFYQVVIKNPVTGTEFNYFLQVMENVFYEGPSNRMFDLKGSMRNRKIQSTGEQNEVLLDENLLDYISQSPVYVRNHSNSILASSICNDTLFCSKQNVMDYSLIVGLYEDRKELLVGIIDYIRTYTWDKKLESWIKDRGKHKATVRSPKDYRNRFRASIPRYFPLAPSCWQVFGTQRIVELPHSTLEVVQAEEERAEHSHTETGTEEDKE